MDWAAPRFERIRRLTQGEEHMTLIEAAKLTLEALGNTHTQPGCEQGPVAFNRKAVWNVLFEVWNQNISASEGLQKLQDLYTTPPAAPVPLTDERVGRTDREIVDQTDELAGFLMRAFHRREKADPLSTFRGTQDTRAQHCWQIACQIQEMLTDTDPMNAVANVDDEAAHGIMASYHGTCSAEVADYIAENYSMTVFCNGLLRKIVFTPVTKNHYSFKTEAA
jgi:hypothetical protein